MIIRTINDKHTLGSYCYGTIRGLFVLLKALFVALIYFCRFDKRLWHYQLLFLHK